MNNAKPEPDRSRDWHDVKPRKAKHANGQKHNNRFKRCKVCGGQHPELFIDCPHTWRRKNK